MIQRESEDDEYVTNRVIPIVGWNQTEIVCCVNV